MAERNGPKCGAKRHGTTETCTLPAGWGTDHVGTGKCRKHLGNSPNVAKAAAREEAYAQAREELAKLSVRAVSDPVYELRRVGRQVLAWKDVCARMLNRLEPEQLRYLGTIRGEQLRGEVAMWQDSLKLSVSVLTALAKLDLDNWQAAISQQRAENVGAAFAAALRKAGVAPEIESVVRTEFASGLRVLYEEEVRAEEVLTGVVISPR